MNTLPKTLPEKINFWIEYSDYLISSQDNVPDEIYTKFKSWNSLIRLSDEVDNPEVSIINIKDATESLNLWWLDVCGIIQEEVSSIKWSLTLLLPISWTIAMGISDIHWNIMWLIHLNENNISSWLNNLKQKVLQIGVSMSELVIFCWPMFSNLQETLLEELGIIWCNKDNINLYSINTKPSLVAKELFWDEYDNENYADNLLTYLQEYNKKLWVYIENIK